MDYPIKYFLESIIKKFIKDYIEKDVFSLDSISLIGTSGVFRNLILKKEKFNELFSSSGLGVNFLSGMVEEVSIEAYIIKKEAHIRVDGVQLNLLIPYSKLDKFFYKSKNQKNSFSIEEILNENSHKNNKIFSLLNSLSNFIIDILNINLNLFIDFEDYLYQITLKCEDIAINKDSHENLSEILKDSENKGESISRKISLSTFSIHMATFKKKLNKQKYLIESENELKDFMKNKNIYQEEILENLTFTLLISAYDYRYDKSNVEFANNIELTSTQFYQNLEGFGFNTRLDLKITKFDINLKQNVLVNLMRLFLTFDKISKIKKERIERGTKALRNSVEKIKELLKNGQNFPNSYLNLYHRFSKPNYNFTPPIKTELLNYTVYMFLQMVHKKYIKYSMNSYMLARLIFHYKNIIGEEFLIFDYLLEHNIDNFLNMPSISDINNLFLNLDHIEKIQNKTTNKVLEDFLITLLNKFVHIKKLKKSYESFDDFFMIHLNLRSLKFTVAKSPKGENQDREENENALVTNLLYLRNKFHYKIDSSSNIDFSNNLLLFELEELKTTVYTNSTNEYLFLKLNLNSINLWDISYRQIDEDLLRKAYFPILSIKFEIIFNFYKIQKKIHLIEFEIPTVYSCLDPYFIFFATNYLNRINHELLEFNYLKEKIPQEEEETVNDKGNLNKYYTSTKNSLFFIENARVSILRLVVHCNFSKIDIPQKTGISLNLNKVVFDYNNFNANIELNIEELILGSVTNNKVFDFLNYKSNMTFNSNILNLFQIYQVVDYNSLSLDKCIKMPFMEIFVKLTKNDIHIVENYLFAFDILKKFKPNYKLITDEILNNPKNVSHTNLTDIEKGRNSIQYQSTSEKKLGASFLNFNNYNGLSNQNNQQHSINIANTKEEVESQSSQTSENADENSISNSKHDDLRQQVITVDPKILNASKFDNVLISRRKKNTGFFDYLFISIPIVKFVVQIKLTSDDSDNQDDIFLTRTKYKNPNKYKHLILVIDNIDFYFLIDSRSSLFLCTLWKLNMIQRTSNQVRKLIEVETKNVQPTMNYNEFIKQKKNNFKDISSFIFYGQELTNVTFLSSIPPIFLGIDHVLIKYIIDFLFSSNNHFNEEIMHEATNLLVKLTQNNTYFSYYIHIDQENNMRTIRKRKTTSKVTIMKLKISEINIETFLENSTFFSLATSVLYFNYDSSLESLDVKTNLKYLNDERLISSYNKYILFNPNSFIKLELNWLMADNINSMEIIVENPLITFLMRPIMDIIEYCYFIFVRDILEQYPSEAVFSKTPEELEKFTLKDVNDLKINKHNDLPLPEKEKVIKSSERNLNLSDYLTEQEYKYSSNKKYSYNLNTNLRKNVMQGERLRRQGLAPIKKDDQVYDYTIEEEKEKLPLKFKLICRNGEMLIAMNSVKRDKINFQDFENSIKNDKLILSFSEIEYCNFIENEHVRDAYHTVMNYRNQKIPNEKKVELKDIQMYVKVKDARFYIIPHAQSEVDFGWFYNRDERGTRKNTKDHPPNEDINKSQSQYDSFNLHNFISSFTLLIELTPDFFSICKIYLIIPYLKLRLFPDTYEKLMRVFFENLMEEQTVVAECSAHCRKFFKKYDINKTFMEFAIFADETNINIYNFPTTCLMHKSDKFIKFPMTHSQVGDCKYSKLNPPIELDKLCYVKLTNLYVLMRFMSNGEKNTYIDSETLGCELNKYLKAFAKLNSFDLIKSNLITRSEIYKERDNNNVLISEPGGATYRKSNPDNQETVPNPLSSCKSVIVDIFMYKNNVKDFMISLNNLRINFIWLPLLSLKNFFSKFFFFYQNKNVKIVDYDESPVKNMQIKLRDLELILQSNYIESRNSFYELDIKCDIDMLTKTIGNTTLGPCTDLRQFGFFIRSIYLNDFKRKKYGSTTINFGFNRDSGQQGSSNVNTIRNQIVDNLNLDMEIFSKADDKLQLENRFYYLYAKIKGLDYNYKANQYCFSANLRYSQNDSNVELEYFNFESDKDYKNKVNIKKDEPYKFKEYIKNFKFNERDFIDQFNNRYKEKKFNSNFLINQWNKVGILESKENYVNNGYEGKEIKISLNMNQIFQLQKIFGDINKDYNDNYKQILYPYSEKSSFDSITYNCNYAFYISEFEVKISDSQFNTKLFKINFYDFLSFITTDPETGKLSEEVAEINRKYHNIDDIRKCENTRGAMIEKYYNYYEEQEEEKLKIQEQLTKKELHEKLKESDRDKKFTFDLLTKFLIKVSYHNNTTSVWEPFIEPLPAMFSYFKSEEQEYVLFDILSLNQISVGIENLCRQKLFHSLNLNINENLLENLQSLIKDHNKTQNKNLLSSSTTELSKKMIIKNLTEYKMNVINVRDFEDIHEIPEDSKFVFHYKKDKLMNYREILKVNFLNLLNVEEKKGGGNIMCKGSIVNNFNNYINYSNLHQPSPKSKRGNNLNTFLAHGNDDQSLLEESRNVQTNLVLNSPNNNFIPQSQTVNSQSIRDKAVLEINIEKSSKLFTILKNEKTNTSKKLEMDELRKHFDEKFSILIPGEQFLVSEVELNIDTNTKSVTFRSNEGIKNDLDFPVKIKFILKDGVSHRIASFYEKAIIIEPRFVYYIPPVLLDKIKVIEIKPIFLQNGALDFHSGIYPIDQVDISTDDNNFTMVYCKIKNFNFIEAKKDLYLEHIAFAVIKKYEIAENEFLDNNIKKRIEWIKSYSKFKGREYESENKKRLDKILCDVTYVLSPVIRFYNSLPRDIVIHKMFPDDIKNNTKKCKGPLKELRDFDVENFIKVYSTTYKKIDLELVSPQDYYVCYRQANFENFEVVKSRNVSISINDDDLSDIGSSNANSVSVNHSVVNEEDSSKYHQNVFDDIRIKANGDFLSIYEPYLLQEKYAKYLRYRVRVEEIQMNRDKDSYGRRQAFSDKNLSRKNSGISNRKSIRRSKSKKSIDSGEMNNSSTEIKPKEFSYKTEFIIKPFKFKRIMKMLKTYNEYLKRFSTSQPGRNMILNLDPLNPKPEITTFFSTKKNYGVSDILLYTYEFTPNKMLNTHLYCPYLFINSSELDLVLSYKRFTEKPLPNEIKEKGGVSLKKEQMDENEILNRITMFYPEDKKNFKFDICNKSIKQKGPIKILDIASTGKVVEIINKETNFARRHTNIIISRHPSKISESNFIEEFDEDPKNFKKNQVNINQRVLAVEKNDKRIIISMQMEVLNNALKWSKLIFITPAIYIFNTTKRDIYIYHFNKNSKGPNKYEVVRSKKTIKFYYLKKFYEFIKISFEDKLNPDDTKLYSGLIRLIANNEFYVTLGEREKEGIKTLLFIKVYKVYGFLYVVIKHKETITDYPYFIVNNLNRVIKYKQKEFMDEEMLDFFKYSNIKMNIQAQELPGIGNDTTFLTNINQTDYNKSLAVNPYSAADSDNFAELDSPKNVHHFTWDEPFMRNKNNRNILEIIFFGSKFDIDLDDIHEEIKFFDRAKFTGDNNLYLNDKPIKGTLSVKDGINAREFSYALYEYALYISDQQGRQTKFEFHDRDLGFYRKSNGKIVLKKNKEYEVHCISDEETNILAGRIYKSIDKAREFVNSIIIKKFVKNKSIYVEITKKNSVNSYNTRTSIKKFKTLLICNIQNVSISIIQKNYEFMYLWLNDISVALLKSKSKYKKMSFRIKDYQIDHYLDNSYYPIVLSPLSDRSLDPIDSKHDYFNIDIEITNLKVSSNFYQVDRVYVILQSMDLRLEYKFIEKLNSFIQSAKRIFSVQVDMGNNKDIKNIINEIDACSYVDEKVVMSYENFLLIKQIMISDMKISFSLKFENIDMFLEKTAFLFLKPLIEELGLKILNMDTAMFTFVPFIRNNIYQSTDEFMNIFSTFYYNQLVSELVKSLGGITSITSLQLVESLNNNILSNMRLEKNSLARINKKSNKIRELYKSGFENISQIVGGLFMLAFKMISVVGRFLAYLTFDETFQQRRSYKLNKSVKSLWGGIVLAIKILMFAYVYTFTQFYFVSARMYGKYKIWGIFLAILIILFGIIMKPIIGIVDCTTKILESISFTINDVLGDRVKKLARYQRNIKDSELRDYNCIDALAYTVYKQLETDNINTAFEDIQLALPGIKKDKRVLLLFTTDRIIIVDHDDYRFIPIYQIHFSECKLFNNSTLPVHHAPHLSILGKRLGFLTNEQGERILYIYFHSDRRNWCGCSKKNFELRIKLMNFDEHSVIGERYNAVMDMIFNKYCDMDK